MSTAKDVGAWTGPAVLRRTVGRNKRWLIPGTALIALHQLCEVAVPVLIGIIVDRAVSTGSTSAMVRWIAALAALFVVLTLVYRFGARMLMFAIAREAHLLRVELSAKMLNPLGIRTDYKAGELLSITSNDAEETAFLIDYVARIAGAVVATAACGVLLLSIDLPLGLMVLIGIPIVVAGLQRTAPIIAERAEQQQAEVGRATALATDLISGHRPLQGIGAQANAAARYRVASRRSLAAALRAARLQSAHAGAAAAAGALAAAAVAVAATYFAMRNDLTLGELIAVVGLAQFLVEPFALLAVAPSEVADSRGSANRVANVLACRTRHAAEPALPAPDGVDPRSLTIRDGLTLDVDPGEFVAVVASDARDATALVDLLSGHVTSPELGTVRVGGRRIGEVPHGQRRSGLLVEHHNGDLFSGTLESNLAIVGTTDPAVVKAALEASCATDVVELHPDGLAHPVVERGASLSGGQRQRWTLARALAADPDVLVLHDPTTSVDAVTEQAIAEGIRRLRGSAGAAGARTTLVLTTSPALLAAADRVVFVGDGRVQAQGTHDELVTAHSGYRAAVAR